MTWSINNNVIYKNKPYEWIPSSCKTHMECCCLAYRHMYIGSVHSMEHWILFNFIVLILAIWKCYRLKISFHVIKDCYPLYMTCKMFHSNASSVIRIHMTPEQWTNDSERKIKEEKMAKIFCSIWNIKFYRCINKTAEIKCDWPKQFKLSNMIYVT